MTKDLERLQKARERVIESIAKNIDLYGVTHSIGRMYGTMYFNDSPSTLDDMSEALGMSKTSMSAGFKVLTDLEMVEKVWVKGVRKDLYRAEDDWYQTFVSFFDIKWRKAIEMNVESIEKSLRELTQLAEGEEVEAEIREQAQVDIGKLRHALGYYEWLERLIDSMESGQIFEWIPKPDRD
jgi:DNA-binding transcriptional regulator GbsR (MarR family)